MSDAVGGSLSIGVTTSRNGDRDVPVRNTAVIVPAVVKI